MADKEVHWDDAARKDLKESLERYVLGHVRLARLDNDEIMQGARDWIADEVPEEESNLFEQFVSDCILQARKEIEISQLSWPEVTDCDRLDRVEAELRDRGIMLWQVSPCCDTCTNAELPDRAWEIDEQFPGFHERLRGYAFFIDQNMPEALEEQTEISVYLAYGWVPDKEGATEDEYASNGLAIAKEVCRCLQDEGFEVDWNGDMSRKIGLSLNWQRRSMLG